jgi:hypothetical protein
VEASLPLLRRHLGRVPGTNPFPRFRERFAADLDGVLGGGLDRFHAYSFANLRQYGACFELAASYLHWLGENGQQGYEAAAESLRSLAETAKAFQFQLARSMARKRALDLSPIDAMGRQWESALGSLADRLG